MQDDELAHELLAREVRRAATTYIAGNWSAIVWLSTFCVSGIVAACAFNLLHLHAGPAKGHTFFLNFLGFWGQLLVGLIWMLLMRSWRTGLWSRGMVGALFLSSLFTMASEALDTLGKMQGGMGLFTMIHASVTLFACVSAVLVLKTRLGPACWLGASLVVGGVIAAKFPSAPVSITVPGSLLWGILCAVLGSLGNAASYVTLELVFAWAREKPSEEQACFYGSLASVLAYTGWTLGFTAEHWHDAVLSPIEHAPLSSYDWAWAGYALWTLAIGVHALSFCKSINKLGTAPTAVSIGVQQAGNLVFAHLFFCETDKDECFWSKASGSTPWDRGRKTVGFTLCCIGCLIYVLGREPAARREARWASANAKVICVSSTGAIDAADVSTSESRGARVPEE